MQGNERRSVRSTGRLAVVVLASAVAFATLGASAASGKYSKDFIKSALNRVLSGSYTGTSTTSNQTSTTSNQTSPAGCEAPSTYQAFSGFGDQGWYYLAPNGGFEQSLTWKSRGSMAIVNETDPFDLNGAADDRSLRLDEDAAVRTPKLCVTSEMPHMRFVAKAARGSGQLDVEINLYAPDGSVTDSSSGSISPSDHAGWSASRRVELKTDSLAPGASGYLDIVFRSQGNWLIDDVLIDPWRRR
jgi:hypothetical protein